MYIKITGKEDLRNVQRLWATPEVMCFVGFPEGLHETMEHLEGKWLPWVQNPPLRQHYSIYDGADYCGESFYDVDDVGYACMDIKLLPAARGKGIASFGLSQALDQAFLVGGAKAAWVDPNPENVSALKLYRRLGFRAARRPEHLEDPGCAYVYMEVTRDQWQAARGIRYRDIILRDMIESDIEDWIRWDTVDTAYMDWDGPDYPSEPVDPEEYRKDMMDFLAEPRAPGFRNFFEIATAEGVHIGRINSYALTPDFQDRRWPEEGENTPFLAAVGIDICESGLWGKGLGKQALTAFILYFLEHGINPICLQTWSGNSRMVRCAEKIGFVECNRIVGNRHIRGGVYDGLTFRLNLDRFHQYLRENP